MAQRGWLPLVTGFPELPWDWHWIRDTQFQDDSHRYQGIGVGAIATLCTGPLILLRLAGS